MAFIQSIASMKSGPKRGNAAMRACAACLCVLLVAGCSREEAPPASAPAPPEPEQARPAKTVELSRLNAEALTRVLERHAGKVVLIDFWATWCEPCIEAFPSIIRWQKAHKDAGLVVVSVATDRASNRQAVLEAVAKFDPPFGVWLLDAPDYDAFVRGVSEEWDGGVPAVFLYDRTGKLRRYFGGEQGAAKVEAAIRELLAEGG